tara:strand:+ start:468 stop:1163 length:696 start_codon:yes stop_codon:yes gene_type:complete
MQQDQQMMIFMLLVVMALMMSRDTHKLFADTTRTWAQFGSSNYKAISALTAAVIVATIGKSVLDVFDGERKGMYNNSQRIAREQRATMDNIFEAGQRNLAKLAARQTMENAAEQGAAAGGPQAYVPPAPKAAAQKRPAENWDITETETYPAQRRRTSENWATSPTAAGAGGTIKDLGTVTYVQRDTGRRTTGTICPDGKGVIDFQGRSRNTLDFCNSIDRQAAAGPSKYIM